MKGRLLFIGWFIYILIMFFGLPCIAISAGSPAIGIVWLMWIIVMTIIAEIKGSDIGYSNGDW